MSGKFKGTSPTVARISRDDRNPLTRPELTYQEACTAELTTLSAVELHEQRLFQPGYTPTAIRNNILDMLRTSKPNQHMVDFQEKDIPPQKRDPQTHRILTGLLQQRNKLDRDFQLPTNSVAADDTKRERI